ncbi:MAG: DMSO/selenate family reductase complex B subunit, partial [Anaerolineaceae bacterium]
MAKQLGFYFNSDICVGCKTCQIACKDKNDLPVGITWRRVVEYGGGDWGKRDGVMAPKGIFGYFISIACNHCANPACVKACPTGAMHKGENGIVSVDMEKCVGCRYCEWACPYGAPQFNDEKGVMTKCNFCEDLLAQDQQPACVSACAMRALEFGEIDELRAKYGSEVEIEPLPTSEITHPSLVINPNRNAQPT